MKHPNIKEFQINAIHLRGAQLCEGKKDIRYYLNGICLSKTGHIYGTNGHICFKAGLPAEIKKQIKQHDWIIQLESVIPESAVLATIDFIDDKKGIVTLFNKNYTEFKHIFFTVIDGKYPAVETVFTNLKKKRKPTESIGINPDYVATGQKVFKKARGFIMTFSGDDNAVHLFTGHPDFENVEVLIMPMRME